MLHNNNNAVDFRQLWVLPDANTKDSIIYAHATNGVVRCNRYLTLARRQGIVQLYRVQLRDSQLCGS